jgi:hypothetical protein
MMRPDELERRLRERLNALGSAPPRRAAPRPDAPRHRARRADRRVLVLPAEPDLRRLLIDCEEDRTSERCSSGCCGKGLSLPGHWANREPSPTDAGLAGRLDCRLVDARAQMPY